MKHLTLLPGSPVSNIARIWDVSPEDATGMILSKLSLLDDALDDECNAGENVVMVMTESELDVETFLSTLLPESAYEDFMGLTFWGLDGECERCGCRLEEIDSYYNDDRELIGVTKCVNCENVTSKIIVSGF